MTKKNKKNKAASEGDSSDLQRAQVQPQTLGQAHTQHKETPVQAPASRPEAAAAPTESGSPPEVDTPPPAPTSAPVPQPLSSADGEKCESKQQKPESMKLAYLHHRSMQASCKPSQIDGDAAVTSATSNPSQSELDNHAEFGRYSDSSNVPMTEIVFKTPMEREEEEGEEEEAAALGDGIAQPENVWKIITEADPVHETLIQIAIPQQQMDIESKAAPSRANSSLIALMLSWSTSLNQFSPLPVNLSLVVAFINQLLRVLPSLLVAFVPSLAILLVQLWVLIVALSVQLWLVVAWQSVKLYLRVIFFPLWMGKKALEHFAQRTMGGFSQACF